MKSFVVLTYYQLMHSVAMALDLDEKPNLYFSTNYLNIEEPFLERIRETGIFHEVVGLSQEAYVTPFIEELKQTENFTDAEIDTVGDSIFEKYLEPHYGELFKNADFQDDIYVYNDFHRHYYYIAKHFKNIIGVEDGYQSLEQQLKVHCFKGNHKLVEPFLGKYYPEPLYKHPNVKRIISSCNFSDLPEYYKEKLEVLDYKDLLELHKSQFMEAMLHIFKLGDLEIESNSILLLGTPLARARYCDDVKAYLFYRKLIKQLMKENANTKLYIKPHPADTLYYELFENQQVVVLDKEFPIELLEYKGETFKETISFGSTAILDRLSDKNRRMYNGDGSISDIKNYINLYVKDEKLIFNVYIKVKKINPDTVVNIMSYLKSYKNFDIHVNLMIDSAIYPQCENLFSIENLKKEVLTYKKKLENSKERAFYSREIDALAENPEADLIRNWNIVSVESCDDEYIFENYIQDASFDYCLLVDSENLGIHVLKKCIATLRQKNAFAYTFLNYTYRSAQSREKVFLGSGTVKNHYTNCISNRIFHKLLLEKYKESRYENNLPVLLNQYSPYIMQRVVLFLHLESDIYFFNNYGKAVFIQKIMNQYDSSDREKNLEYTVGQIAVELMEYYNWIKVIHPKMVDGAITNLLDELKLPTDYKLKILQLLMETLLHERNIEQSRAIYKDLSLYDYSKKSIESLMISGKIENEHLNLYQLGVNSKKKNNDSLYKKIKRYITKK